MWDKIWSVVYFFSCFIGLGTLEFLLAMYTTGDVSKIISKFKIPK